MYREIAGTDEQVRAIPGVRDRRVRATKVRLYYILNGQMHGWTDKPKAICPFNFSKVGGMIFFFTGFKVKTNKRETY